MNVPMQAAEISESLSVHFPFDWGTPTISRKDNGYEVRWDGVNHFWTNGRHGTYVSDRDNAIYIYNEDGNLVLFDDTKKPLASIFRTGPFSRPA